MLGNFQIFDILALVTGVAGIAVLSISMFPQVVHSFKHGTKGVSYWGSVAMVAVDLSWLLYAIFATVYAAIVADFIGVTLGTVLLFLVARNSRRSLWLTSACVVGLAGAAVTAGTVDPLLIGFVAAGLSFTWRTFQLGNVLVEPDISGVSLRMWILNAAGVSIWGAHGIFIGDWFLAVSCLSLGAYAGFIAGAVAVRRSRDAITHEQRDSVGTSPPQV